MSRLATYTLTQKREPGNRLITLTNPVNDAYRKLGVQGDGQAVGSHAGTGVWPAATNICTNGGFETNTTGWAASDAGSIARSTAQSKFGTASLLVTPSGLNNDGAEFAITTGASTAYAYSAWIFSPTGDTFYVDLSDHIDQGLDGSQVVVAANTWTRIIGTGTTDAHTSRWLTVRKITGNTNQFYVDGVQLETGSIATPYIETDGGTANRAAGRVQIPVPQGFNATAGAVIAKLANSRANTQGPTTAPVFDWRDGANDRLSLSYDTAGAQYIFRRRSTAAAGADLALAATWAAASRNTVMGIWTPAAQKLAFNGGVISADSQAAIPTLAATSTDIGSDATNQLADRFPWVAFYGSGGQFLGNGDSAHVARLGAIIDPLSDLPRPDDLIAFWDGVNDRYLVFA